MRAVVFFLLRDAFALFARPAKHDVTRCTNRRRQLSASPRPRTLSVAAARRAWGEIRARYRLKHLAVPA